MARSKRTWEAFLLSDPKQLLTVIQSGLGVAVLFGLHLTIEQMGAIISFLGALLLWLNSQQPTPKDLSDLTEAAEGLAQAHNVQVDELKSQAAAVIEACDP